VYEILFPNSVFSLSLDGEEKMSDENSTAQNSPQKTNTDKKDVEPDKNR
jgi:hypothetical protein